MSIVKIAKRKDVTFEYDANGFAQEEVLKGNVIRQNLSAVLYSLENL